MRTVGGEQCPLLPSHVIRWGSDAVVAMLTGLGVECVALNPGASFRGIQDSLVHTEGAPRLILCTHEEIAVAVAHGYAKATGRPMAVCVHDLVGLQHASMAIYNSWCDREPVLVLGGSGPRDAATRRPWIEWIHTAVDQGHLVRDYVKWDDEPASIEALGESLVRAYRVAVVRPPGPTYLSIDVSLQESAVPPGYQLPDVGRYEPPSPPVVGDRDLQDVAEALAEARNPIIVAGRMLGIERVVALSEALGAAVLDVGDRLGFPTDHPLNLTGAEDPVLEKADFVLGLEVEDLFGTLYRAGLNQPPLPRGESRVAHIGLRDLVLRSWASDYQRLVPLDHALIGEPEDAAGRLASLLAGAIRPDVLGERMGRIHAQHQALRQGWRMEAERQRQSGSITRAVLTAAVGDHLEGTDWCLAHDGTGGWARRLWSISTPSQYLGRSGGGGIGYALGGSVGAALGRQGRNSLVVDIQGDGDILYTPGALWTAARYEVPVLIVVDNNRSYRNSEQHAVRVAQERDRGPERASIGTEIRDPDVSFSALARAFGVWSRGPILTPVELDGALSQAVAVVREGRPALLDVVTTL